MKFKLCLLLTLILSGVCAIHADEDEPPYIYYYSRLLGGIIIERADGTDSRRIGADVIPAGLEGIRGVGWSPSGKYFAVTLPRYMVIIDTQGNNIASYLRGGLSGAYPVQWSPTGEDILFIVGGQSPSTTFYWLFDVAQGEMLAEYGTSFGLQGDSEPEWDVANGQISFYIAVEFTDVQQYRITMHFDGTVTQKPVTLEEYTPQPFYPDDSNDRYEGNDTSPSGTYTAEGYLPTIVTNTETGEQVEIPIHSQGTICRSYRWNEDDGYVITLNGTIAAGGGCGDVAMGIFNLQNEHWRELGRCGWGLPCVNWLPEQVDLDTLPPGSPTPVQLESIDIEPSDILYGLKPEELNLHFVCDDDSHASIKNDDTNETVYTVIEETCFWNSQALDGIPIVVEHHPTDDLLFTYFEPSSTVTGVDVWMPTGAHYERVLRLNADGYELELSEDGQYLRARNVRGWKIYAVDDILDAIDRNTP